MKTIWTLFLALFISANLATAQDSLYVYKTGTILYKQAANRIDSITFNRVNNTIPSNITVSDIDGNIYHTITINANVNYPNRTLTWMTENLRTTKYRNGDIIPNLVSDADWISTNAGGYCNIANNESVLNEYGRLYNGLAVRDSRGLAPIGWHVATESDWVSLVCQGTTNAYEYISNVNLDSRFLKKSDDNYWSTFHNGFNALPSGERTNGIFLNFGSKGTWWTSSTNTQNGIGSYIFSIYSKYNNYERMIDGSYNKSGFSVRCVKD